MSGSSSRKSPLLTMRVVTLFLAISMALLSAQTIAKQESSNKTLYSRLGGKRAIKLVVDEFVSNLLTDERINKFFTEIANDRRRLASFKGKLVDQICQASGGPCRYTGKDMKTAHKGLGITEGDFNALVEDLVKALDKVIVSATDKNELLGAFSSMKNEVVGEPRSFACEPGVCPMHGTCKRKCKKNPCICSKE